ncbi:MAG: TonB-dependent receptor, partial [Mesorhizobium sp.]
MGLANWGRLGLANGSPGRAHRSPAHRSMAKGMAALLAGAAAIALLTPSANAQQAAQPTADQQQAEQAQTPEEAAPAGATLLDQILVISRTGETAIDSLASVSHVDQEQLERRMATTPNEMLLGVPGVAVQADARRVSSSINIRGLQDFGRVAVIVDGARQNFQRSDHGTQSTFYIDPELIKSVDVIRGPVANTY